MLNKLDDYPVHQTPEPLAHPATSDRNAYDRTWYNGYAADGSYYFGMGMAVYPHRGVLDCAFSVVRPGGLQRCFFASRRAPHERTEMQVGPMRIEVLEPMKQARLTLDDNDSGVGCELLFSARTAAIQERRQTLWQGTRRVMDATRFAQFGAWSGTVRTPDGDIAVHERECRATKDRSWGLRGVGEPEVGGAPQAPGSFFFLWAPLFWEDHVSHAIFFDGPGGEALVREALTAPLYSEEGAVPDVEDSRVERMAGAAHRIRYRVNTRLAECVELDLIRLNGEVRSIVLEPMLRFQMKGLGYGHPKWRQGAWQGELAMGHDAFDPNELNPLAPENLHVQQVVRARDGTGEGVGVVEQAVIGPYAPSGFRALLDGASN